MYDQIGEACHTETVELFRKAVADHIQNRLMLLGHEPESCGQKGVCSIQGVVKADGTVYPRDFYALDSYALGNINDQKLAEILESEAGKRFLAESRSVSGKCRNCPIIRSAGTAAAGAGFRIRKEPVNYFCEGYRMFFDKALPRLQQIADFYKKRT